ADPSEFSWHAILPCRDEEAVIGRTIERMRGQFPNLHVWVVDDASDDATADIVGQYAATDNQVHLVSRTRPDARTGKGDALNAAYQRITAWLPPDADRDRIIIMVIDADGILAANALRQAAGPAV